LRALGMHVGNMSLWDKKKAIANHYHHFSKSPGKKKQRKQKLKHPLKLYLQVEQQDQYQDPVIY
ncbi:MAG: hypothetical protein ACKPKO_26495, partial [Candidatus Fonsibacter sp.]